MICLFVITEKMIKKEYTINAKANAVFAALTTKSSVEKWTGTSAEMSDKEGSEFSLWDGSIIGQNVEVSPSRIIQKWKESSWEKHSDVVFKIREYGESTKLILEHDNIPEASLQSIDNGWDEYYLGPLKSYVESIQSN